MNELIFIDIHCHSKRILYPDSPPEELAGAMTEGGVSASVLNVVPDGPLLAFVEGGVSVSEPTDNRQIARYVDQVFGIIDTMTAAGEIRVAANSRDLSTIAGAGGPGIVVGIEGADHIEGDLDRIDFDFHRRNVRQIGLVHYKPSDLADNQTEPERHGGLSPLGRAAVRRCNDLGIVVDLAHLSEKAMRDVIDCSAAPVVCSHTSIRHAGDSSVRLLPGEIADMIAGTGGLVGVWPNSTIFPSLESYAEGLARLADRIGVDHIAIGTDRAGLQTSLFLSYASAKQLSGHLLATGFSEAEAVKILGSNYLRVFQAVESLASR